MASSGISADVPRPETSSTIPDTGSAIIAEFRSRQKSIAEKFARLQSVQSVVAKSYRASVDPSKVSSTGLAYLEEIDRETPASAVLASFKPGIEMEAVKKHDSGGVVSVTFPCASLSEVEAASSALLSFFDFWELTLPEGPRQVDLLAPYLRNFRAIDAAVGRALEAVCSPPSRRDAIAAKLAAANALLAEAAALGWDFAPVVSNEATRCHDAAAAPAAVEEATRRERAAAAAAIDAARTKAAALQAELDALRRPRDIPVAPPASAAPEPEFAPHGLTPPQAAKLQVAVGGSGSPGAWTEVYCGSRDGFTAASFHRLCDGKARLLVLVKDKEASWLFGGFIALGFIKGADRYYADPAAFLFSLTNPAGRPERLASHGDEFGVGYISSCLAILGASGDLYIADECASNKRSQTNAGRSYAAPSVAGSHPMAQSQGRVY